MSADPGVKLVADAIGWGYTSCEHDGTTYTECDEHRAHAVLAALAAAGRLRAPVDDEIDAQVLRERDEAIGWADRLADAIAKATGVDLEAGGEGSTIDAPWRRALAAMSAVSFEHLSLYELGVEEGRRREREDLAGRLLPEDTRRHVAAIRAERDQYAAEIASLRDLISKYGDDGWIPASALREAFRVGPWVPVPEEKQ